MVNASTRCFPKPVNYLGPSALHLFIGVNDLVITEKINRMNRTIELCRPTRGNTYILID